MKSRQLALAAALALIVGSALSATPQEAKLLAGLQKAHPGTKFTSVSESAVPGIFEVWMGTNVAFVSAKNPRYFIFGRVIDTATMTDITGPKLARPDKAIVLSCRKRSCVTVNCNPRKRSEFTLLLICCVCMPRFSSRAVTKS